MRLNLKVVLVFLCVAVFFITITFWSQCGDISLAPGFLHKWDRRIYGGKLCRLSAPFIRLTWISH